MSRSGSFSLLIFLTFLNFSSAQFGQCDYAWKLTAVGQSMSLVYPGTIKGGTSCRFSIISPVGTLIESSCSYDIAGPQTSCPTQKLFVSRSGDKETRDASYLCGRGSTKQLSIGNELVIALRSTVFNSASLQCSFKSIAQSNANCECGWNIRGRIVGGSFAGINEFVSHAGLVDARTKVVFCGSTILTQTTILSAAHCFDAYPNAAATAVLVGDHDLTTGSDTMWSAAYPLLSYVKHGSYNRETNANDIALARVRDYIKFNKGVGPACLPYTFMQNDRFFDGKTVTAVGWGLTEFAGQASNILKKANLKVVDIQTCAQKNQFITSANICTQESRAASTCQQDSGGGLYWASARKYVVGIVSYGTYCASSIPSVNIRITSYIGWIEGNVGEFLCRKA